MNDIDIVDGHVYRAIAGDANPEVRSIDDAAREFDAGAGGHPNRRRASGIAPAARLPRWRPL